MSKKSGTSSSRKNKITTTSPETAPSPDRRSEALPDDKNLMQLVLDNTQEIIFAVDRQYRLIFANRAQQQAVLATGKKELPIGESVLSDVYTPEVRAH